MATIKPYTSIAVKFATHERLSNIARHGESFDSVVSKALDCYERNARTGGSKSK